MTRGVRGGLLCLLLVILMIAGWRIVAVTMADWEAIDAPEEALRWQPSNPDALLRQAIDPTRTTDPATAARTLLARAPLAGEGFVLLAGAADRAGDPVKALALYRIAARRAPRDPQVHAWLADRALKTGDDVGALQQIDTMLRVTPNLRDALIPAMVRNAADPAFAAALVDTLDRRPSWRANLLLALQSSSDQTSASRVMGALQRKGDLEPDEIRAWMAQLMRQGRWGEAYARWAGMLHLNGKALPALYNGGFDTAPTGADSGFDWHLLRIPGVLTEFTPVDGTRGMAAHAVFLGRPVDQVNLEHPLFLTPGNYRLSVRMRAQDLDSSQGLEWALTCQEQLQALGTTDRINGSFAWRDVTMDFTVPAEGCAGQWLRLLNPAPSGSARIVTGGLWFDDVAISVRHGVGDPAPGGDQSSDGGA